MLSRRSGRRVQAIWRSYREISCSASPDWTFPHQQVNQHNGGGLGPPTSPGQRTDPGSQLSHLDHSDVFDRASDQIVERREVVGGRRQRQTGPPRHRPVAYRLEPALAEQLRGGADQRIPPTFSFGVTAAVTPIHAASQSGTALPIRPNVHGMMARMPELSRRAVLGLGAGTVLGATSAYAIDMLLQPRTSHAAPAAAIGTNVPLAPTPALDPAPRLRRRRRCPPARSCRQRAPGR